MFAQLGDHRFEGLKTPASFSGSEAVQFGQIARINRKPVVQPTGRELAELSLTLRFTTDFCEPSEEIEALRGSMQRFEVLPYITGEGRIVGKFVITSLDGTAERCGADGRVEMATVTLGLLESVGENEPAAATGTALSSRNPVVQPAASPVPAAAASITADLATARNGVAGIGRTVASIRQRTTSFKRGVRQVRQLADGVQEAYATAKTKVTATRKIIARASQLPTSLDEAIAWAENLARLDDTADLTVLEMQVGQLTASAAQVTADAAPVVGFVATKEGGE